MYLKVKFRVLKIPLRNSNRGTASQSVTQSHEPKATHQNSESIYQLPKATHQLSYRYRALLGSISKGHKSQRGGSNPTLTFGTPGAPRWNHPTASPLTRPHMRSLMCGPGHTTGRTPSGRHIPWVKLVR